MKIFFCIVLLCILATSSYIYIYIYMYIYMCQSSHMCLCILATSSFIYIYIYIYVSVLISQFISPPPLEAISTESQPTPLDNLDWGVLSKWSWGGVKGPCFYTPVVISHWIHYYGKGKRSWIQWSTGSRVHRWALGCMGFSSCSTQVLEHRLKLLCGMWDLPGSGASPALSGKFFTTEPPGKPRTYLLSSRILFPRLKQKKNKQIY